MDWGTVHDKIRSINLVDTSVLPYRLVIDIERAVCMSNGLTGKTRTQFEKQQFLFCIGICNDAFQYLT